MLREHDHRDGDIIRILPVRFCRKCGQQKFRYPNGTLICRSCRKAAISLRRSDIRERAAKRKQFLVDSDAEWDAKFAKLVDPHYYSTNNFPRWTPIKTASNNFPIDTLRQDDSGLLEWAYRAKSERIRTD